MDMGYSRSDVVVMEKMTVGSVLVALRFLACLLVVTGSLLNDVDVLPKLTGSDQRFPMDELHRMKPPVPENKDASDSEDDDEDDDDNADDDDADDEDFSGEEGGEDDKEVDRKEDPAANGHDGSDEDDDEDDEDDDDDDDDDDDGDSDDEDEDDEDEEDQPPAKKRK